MAPAGKRPNRPALEKQLAQYRMRGYAKTSSERVPGVTAISVPIPGADNMPYCISITGPAIRVDRRADEFIALLLNAGRMISRQMGAATASAAKGKPAGLFAGAQASGLLAIGGIKTKILHPGHPLESLDG